MLLFVSSESLGGSSSQEKKKVLASFVGSVLSWNEGSNAGNGRYSSSNGLIVSLSRIGHDS